MFAGFFVVRKRFDFLIIRIIRGAMKVPKRNQLTPDEIAASLSKQRAFEIAKRLGLDLDDFEYMDGFPAYFRRKIFKHGIPESLASFNLSIKNP